MLQYGIANLRTSTKILDFRGFDSSIVLSSTDGILMSIRNSPEMLSQGILVGRFLVGKLGVYRLGSALGAQKS